MGMVVMLQVRVSMGVGIPPPLTDTCTPLLPLLPPTQAVAGGSAIRPSTCSTTATGAVSGAALGPPAGADGVEAESPDGVVHVAVERGGSLGVGVVAKALEFQVASGSKVGGLAVADEGWL